MNTNTTHEGEPAPNQGKRKFLKILGGGVIVAAVGGGIFATTRTPTKALEPWKMALGPNASVDPRRIVLSHAILAPNPHNRQPWLVELKGDDQIVLYCDLDRRLPHTDPFDRQITVGLGCFLELAEITARQIGMKMDIDVFPQGDAQPRLNGSPVARMKLTKADVSADPLFAQIFDRRSNKEPYDVSKSVDAVSATTMVSVAGEGVMTGAITDAGQAAVLREIAWNAMNTELHTYRTAKESIDLLRIGKAEIEANPDGIDLGGAFFEVLDAAGMMSREDMLDTNSTVFKQQIDAIKELFTTANGFVYVKTAGNSRSDQIAAGRAYVRINLKATEMGIAMQPWSQALQEFPEVAPQYAEIRTALEVSEQETLQMFARIGYGEPANPSPRWAYDTRIRQS